MRETAESYGKMDLDEMDSVGAQIEQLNYNSRFLHDGITIMSKSLYATLDKGWRPPEEHFDIKLDDTLNMTDIERSDFRPWSHSRTRVACSFLPFLTQNPLGRSCN